MAKTSDQIFAFFGSDDGRVKEDALKLSRKLTPEANADFGLELINGTAETSDHAASIVYQTIEALQTIPFFGGDKTVWLQGANFLGDTVTGRAAATLEAVERFTAVLEAGLAPGVRLIISGAEIDKRRAFYKSLKKLGQITLHDLPDPSKPGWEEACMRLVKTRAKEKNLAFEPEALEHFVMITGENARVLESELEKLALYTGSDAPATVDDVRAVVTQTRAGVIFGIGDAMADRDLPRTLELIEQQLRRGENPIGILMAAIVPRVRNLLLARDLTETHGLKPSNYNHYQSALERLPKSATAHLPRKKDGGISAYPIFLAAKSCRKFTTEELRTGLKFCLEANLRLVTTQLEPRTVLAQLATRLLQPAQR